MDNIDILKNGINQFGMQISDEKINKFVKYKDLILEWNQKINLTAIEDEKEIYIKHFIDSVSSIMKGYIKMRYL